VSGLRGDTEVVGNDFRVQDGGLYDVGDKGGISTLSTAYAKATKGFQLAVGLAGRQLGVGFRTGDGG